MLPCDKAPSSFGFWFGVLPIGDWNCKRRHCERLEFEPSAFLKVLDVHGAVGDDCDNPQSRRPLSGLHTSISRTLFIPHRSEGASTRHQPRAAPLCSSPYIRSSQVHTTAGTRSLSHVAWHPGACSSVGAWLRWGAPFQAVCESDRRRVDFVGICPRSVAGGEARLGADVARSEPSRNPIVSWCGCGKV